MLRRSVWTFACLLLAACGTVEEVRQEPWRMVQTPADRYHALYREHFDAGNRFLRRKDYSSAVASFGKAYDAAGQLFSPMLQSNALRSLGEANSRLGNRAQAESLFKRSLQIRESLLGLDSRFVADLLNDLAVEYRKAGRYDEAMPLLERAARIYDATGQRRDLAVVVNNIGHVQDGRGELAAAEASFGRALAITEGEMGRNPPSNHPGSLQRLLHLKEYARAVRKSGRTAEAERLDAQLNDLTQGLRTHADSLRQRGRLESADYLEGRLREILSD